ncbi:MAG: primosomal protein N' [Saprospirales bacterium]|nr:MAG: primosomal protein N' [Saprospirales bacterium]
MKNTFAEIILPLALKGTFTYSVPDFLLNIVKPGCRVEVQFGRSRFYSGIVASIHQNPRDDIKLKEIIDIIDEKPIIDKAHLKFWKWVAEYYACSLGEVMNAALPSALKLNSQTLLIPGFAINEEHDNLPDDAFILWEALQQQDSISLDMARTIVGKKQITKTLESLIYKGIAELREELKDKYQPVKLRHVNLLEPYKTKPDLAFALLDKSEPQTNAFLAILQKKQEFVATNEILANPLIKEHAIKGLEKKGIIHSQYLEVSRIKEETDSFEGELELSPQQQSAYDGIYSAWNTQNVVLLHGVTGSGKTVIYKKLIENIVNEGGQVLYLLPEIALTTQIIKRIEKMLNLPVQVYHSRENIQKRVEIWKGAKDSIPLILGARSSLFLPFSNLKLIIVDEEHDNSFKQRDPAPRYNARDGALVLANIMKARVLLGTATPSLESYFNFKNNKYGYVQLNERFGSIGLPEVELVDLKKARSQKSMKGPFSFYLLEEMRKTLDSKRQIILFQNRRGFAPAIQCEVCSWTMECRQCDVSMTYHKKLSEMKCHYCSQTSTLPKECPACTSTRLKLMGFGTEKIEEELQILLPEIRIGRIDSDNARSKKRLEKIIYEFETGKLDVIIGTQMITKGLDFNNVGLVGIINADQILNFPDFRSAERAFQLMCQVAGRAGRKEKEGKVIIQTAQTEHPIFKDIMKSDFKSFYYREIRDRAKYHYPPVYRNIILEISHKDLNTLWRAASLLSNQFQKKYGNRVLGPAEPMVSRVKNQFLLEFMFKLEKQSTLLKLIKDHIHALMDTLSGQKEFRGLRFKIDVDPQ